jgi:hypothetical protein
MGRLHLTNGIRAAAILATFAIVAASATSAAKKHMRRQPGPRSTNATPFEMKSSGSAHAIAPRDWEITTNAQGSAVDLGSPDKSMYAGWGVIAINRSMQPYYGSLYGDPATSQLTQVDLLVKSQGDGSTPRYTSQARSFGDGYFYTRSFSSARKQGVIFSHIYPTGGGNYIESTYFAMAEKPVWAKKGPMIVNIALSIRSTVQLTPPTDNGGWSPSGSRRKTDATSEENKAFKDYNMQLGTQWFHDSNGGIYNLDVTNDYSQDGPDGPGYYRRAGNSWEKLEPGAE